jgi:post-segregation antitoxin (ccd killing protein)
MSATTRITVTLPSEQVAELKKITENVSGFVAEAVARQIRHRLLVDELSRYQSEFGEFTQEELAEARARLLGASGATAGTAA